MEVIDRTITIVGCGPGSVDYVTGAAENAVDRAEVLVGAQRLLDLFQNSSAERVVVGGGISEVLEEIENRLSATSVTILVTGDPGLFSLAKLVIERFGRDRCRIIPGISSVQAAFAQIGLDWADAKIVSTHKQDPEPHPSLRSAEKIAILAGRKPSLKWIADHVLADFADDRRIFVMENLTLDDETIREVRHDELSTLNVGPNTVVVIVKRSLIE
ncbi:MAG: precorrin-6y C5,15-methyltransferase (decarboxylating) subunit CbiE [Desulfomonilaceae bacterium]|nr:precorrin-6y C5,15-methyltransferase (decarboxylating) subunit CbiE [Desulfomonilaceae bacterium]